MNEEITRIKGPDDMYCPECGKPVKKDAVVCINCGVQLKELKVSQPSPVNTSPVVKDMLKEGRLQLRGIRGFYWFFIVIYTIAYFATNIILIIGIIDVNDYSRYFKIAIIIITAVYIVLLILYIIPLIGIIQRKPFSVPFTRAMLIISMFNFPIGTIIGGVLWKRINHPAAKKYLNPEIPPEKNKKLIITLSIVLPIFFIFLAITLFFVISITNPEFKDIVISSNINTDTFEPLDENTEFEASAENIYSTIKYSYVKGDDNYRFKWTNLDTGEIVVDAGDEYARDMEGKYISGIAVARVSSGDFELKIIPPGDYKVEYYHNGEVVKTATFKVTGEARGSRIVFASDRDGNYEVYMMNSDGTNLINLTSNAAEDNYPAWAPEGIIMFESNRDGNAEIYGMRLDGTDLTNITNSEGSDIYPALSPDTNVLAFASNATGNFDIYIDDGSNVVNLTNDESDDAYPTWTSDSEKIIFSSDRSGDYELYVMNLDGSELINLTNNTAWDMMPDVSPDNGNIVFASDRDGDFEIYLLSQDGNITRLTDNEAHDWVPAWSPDGSKIAFSSERDGNDEIYTMNADGSDQTRITNNEAADWYPCWY
jgi:Tol biopolymer transport system component